MQLFVERVSERLSAKRAEIAVRLNNATGSTLESLTDELPINIKKVLRDLADEKKRREKQLKTKVAVKAISVAPALEPKDSGGGDGDRGDGGNERPRRAPARNRARDAR
jgi:hypothetical protein